MPFLDFNKTFDKIRKLQRFGELPMMHLSEISIFYQPTLTKNSPKLYYNIIIAIEYNIISIDANLATI